MSLMKVSTRNDHKAKMQKAAHWPTEQGIAVLHLVRQGKANEKNKDTASTCAKTESTQRW